MLCLINVRNTNYNITTMIIIAIITHMFLPLGWFSCKGAGFESEGWSFTLDPVYSHPSDPQWHEFLRQATEFAVKHGARLSVSQSRFVSPTKPFILIYF